MTFLEMITPRDTMQVVYAFCAVGIPLIILIIRWIIVFKVAEIISGNKDKE